MTPTFHRAYFREFLKECQAVRKRQKERKRNMETFVAAFKQQPEETPKNYYQQLAKDLKL